jgi:hypothetical protein
MPLLWNMFVAIRIWIQLDRSIPAAFKKYYSFTPDPTAGKVTVVARMPSLKMPGLWSTDPPNGLPARSPSEKQEPHSRIHASLLAMGMPPPSTAMIAPDATKNNIRPPPASKTIEGRRLLRRNWMSLVDRCGLVVKEFHHDGNENDDDPSDEEESRFMVAIDMKASDRTPLKMNWVQFVWLALALGASAYDPSWHTKFPYSLKDREDEDFVYLFYEEGRLFARSGLRGKFSYSLPRAFAWYNIKLDGELLSPLGLGNVAQVSLEHVAISPELSACRPGMSLGSQGCSNILRGKEPQDCSNPLAAACCWMLYWRRQYDQFHELLPISQHLLEYRLRVLCHLRLLDDEGKLITKVRSLLLEKTDDNVTTQYGSSLDTASVTSETILPHPEPPQSFPTKTKVTKSKQHVGDVPLSAHHHQSQAESIVGQLRLSFASSEYVQKHAELCEQFSLVEPYLQARHSATRGFRNSLLKDSKNPVTAVTLEHSLSPLAPKAGWSTKSRSDRDLYGLIPSHPKAKFESAVQSWASDPDGPNGSRWGRDDGKGFLAYVALALAGWDSHELIAWQPHSDLQTVSDRLNKLLAATTLDPFARKMFNWDIQSHDHDGDRFRCLLQDFTTGVLEKGLFTPPAENSVSRLFQLRENDAMVYLL